MSDQEPEARQSSPEKRSPDAREAGAARKTAEPARPGLPVVLASVLGLGVLLSVGVWERDFWFEGELRVAAAVREAAESGDWLIPRLGGEAELSRPPLVFWMARLAALIPGGDPRWSYRLPVILSALVSLTLTWRLGRTVFGGGVGFAAMLVQASTFFFFTHATRLGGDVVFAMFCQLAVAGLALASRAREGEGLPWALLGWTALGGAALSKSFLLGPLLVLGSLSGFLLFRGGPAAFLRGWTGIRVLPGLALLLALVAPWYVGVYLREGADALAACLPSHLGVVGDAIRTVRPVTHHVLVGLIAFLPWTLFVPLGLYYGKDRLKQGGEGLCFSATLFPLVLLSAVPAKEPGDLLVLVPYISLLIAVSLHATGEYFSLWEGYLRVGSLWAARVLLVLPLFLFGTLAAMYWIDLAVGESWLTQTVAFTLDLFGVLPAGGEVRLWVALREPGTLAVPLGATLITSIAAFIASFRLRRRMAAREFGRALVEIAIVILFLFAAGGLFSRGANPLASSSEFVAKVSERVGGAPLTLYGSRPAAFYYYMSRPPGYIEGFRPASGDETTIGRLRELAGRPERVFIVAPKSAFDLLRRDYPTLTGALKEVDRGYLGWSREMVLVSNRS